MRPERRGSIQPPGHSKTRFLAALASLALVGLHCSTVPAPDAPAASLEPRFLDAALASDDDGYVFVAATEVFGSAKQIFTASSDRYGESWNPQFTYVSHSQDGDRGRPQLAAGGRGQVYVVWEDTRQGRVDIFFNRSLDGGRSWLASDVQINNDARLSVELAAPVLRCDRRGNVYVVWRDELAGFPAFYLNRSRDHGTTWLRDPVAVTGVSTAEKSAANLVCDQDGVLVLGWTEIIAGTPGVYVNMSTDHGETWGWDNQWLGRPLVGAVLPRPSLATTPTGFAFATWLGMHAGQPEVLLARSHDQGRTWDVANVRVLQTQTLARLPTQPQMHADRTGNLYVVWQALESNGGSEFLVKSSADQGMSFQETRFQRSGDWSILARFGFQEPQAAAFRSGADDSGNLYFTWSQGEPGASGVGFDRLSNHGTLWLGLTRALGSRGHLPATLEAPLLSHDNAGHVHLLWNEGHTLTVASSPFFGDSGWRYEHF